MHLNPTKTQSEKAESMKEELVDDGYSWAMKASCVDTAQSLLVAKRIKQEWANDFDEGLTFLRTSSPPDQAVDGVTSYTSGYDKPRIPHQPIVFDHFICMRIGLNTENNVQKLMAVLAAHNFVDLTVIQCAATAPAPLDNINSTPAGLLHWPSPSKVKIRARNTLVTKDRYRNYQGKRATLKKAVRMGSEPSTYLPAMLKCTKCGEEMGSGLTFNTVLSHVQKVHLKMAAFQCRICKHYRTTHDRIQSHVTTVHKARSSKFDSSLAGPISVNDMRLMERMISVCFPEVRVKLEITDRLSIRTFEYNGVKT